MKSGPDLMKKLICAALFPFIFLFSGPALAERTVTYRLVLSGESVSETLARTGGSETAKTVVNTAALGKARHAAILKDHAAVESQLAALGLQRLGRTTVVLNSLTVQAPESRLAELKQLPGVRAVYRVNHYERTLVHSVPFVKAPQAWQSPLGLTGKGVRVGIIDSGIDYTHADFGGKGTVAAYTANDSSVIETGTFPTTRVVGGTDLAGDDYDSSGQTGSSNPSPDPDPLDTTAGHGTHVAGILAGGGVLASGKAFAGPYGTNSYTNTFAVGPGVAPEASLYAIKVFGPSGTTGLTIEGLDWAADPNQDGSTSDHMDVVNLSLGSPFGVQDSTDPEEIAIRQLASLGCVVVISAGNSGNTPYIVGTPSTAPDALSVANVMDDAIAFSSTQITAPSSVAGNYQSAEGIFTPQLSVVGPISGQVIYASPNDACSALSNSADLKGKIALVDRGTCFFSDKVRALQTAGAIGVIVVNNVTGPPLQMAGSGTTSDIKIPAVMITLDDGNLLKQQLANGLTARLANTAAIAHPELADSVESSSSRGPALDSSNLKPDMAAPGSQILSASGGTGSGSVSYSGTSMASPHVAGAAAILKQLHPTWSSADIKAVLMNTAVPSHDQQGRLYAESRTGTGRLNVLAAAQTPLLLRNSASVKEVSLSFGALELAGITNIHKPIRIDNRGSARLVALSVSNTFADRGVTLALATNLITLAANAFTTVDAVLTVDPSLLHPQSDPTTPAALSKYPVQPLPEASGQVYATDGTNAAHISWHVLPRALATYAAVTRTMGVPAGNSATVFVPTTGTSAHQAPMVSLFQYGTTSPNRQTTFPDSAADVLAIGAATDFGSAASFAEARVFFGTAVAGKWTTPQRAVISLDVEIDLDGDDQADYTVSNATQGNLVSGDIDSLSDANAALISVAYPSLDSSDPMPGSPLNILTDPTHDTATYHNSVVVQGVKATDIGLTEGFAKFRYRVIATSADFTQDTTAWATFDAAHPLVDSTPYGFEHSPFFDEGRTPQALVNRTNATAGATLVQALLLHQHNAAGKQVELITLHLETPDIDKNGLPDAWELEYFGHLGNSTAADSDGDGVSNADEAAAGTDPTNAASVFRILTASNTSLGAKFVVKWIGAANRRYNLERSTNLAQGFTVYRQGLAGVDGTNAVEDPNPPVEGAVFYRVRIP
jgi:subtilisin family serine protease